MEEENQWTHSVKQRYPQAERERFAMIIKITPLLCEKTCQSECLSTQWGGSTFFLLLFEKCDSYDLRNLNELHEAVAIWYDLQISLMAEKYFDWNFCGTDVNKMTKKWNARHAKILSHVLILIFTHTRRIFYWLCFFAFINFHKI